MDRVRGLSNILKNVDVVLSQLEPDSQEKEELQDITASCQNVLEELEKTFEKYRELESKPESVGEKTSRAWKRLQWEPEDICDLRSRISSNVTLLNTFNGRLAGDSTVKWAENIKRAGEALATIPDDHPDCIALHNNLGNMLESQYKRIGNMEDEEAAIARVRDALAATPHNHPD